MPKRYMDDSPPYKPGPASVMVQGFGVGGPRNGIKLTCPANWDGKLLETANKYYLGRYVWDGKNWVWQDNPDNEIFAAKGPAHHKRRRYPF